MREFKFRYYDPSIKAMLTPSCVGQFGFYAEDRDFEDGNSLPFDRLLQYTGLKDKNGKEIYQGDFVKSPGGTVMLVVWRDDLASFALRKSGWMYDHYFGEAVDAGLVEVIGNEFQNPELLKP